MNHHGSLSAKDADKHAHLEHDVISRCIRLRSSTRDLVVRREDKDREIRALRFTQQRIDSNPRCPEYAIRPDGHGEVVELEPGLDLLSDRECFSRTPDEETRDWISADG